MAQRTFSQGTTSSLWLSRRRALAKFLHEVGPQHLLGVVIGEQVPARGCQGVEYRCRSAVLLFDRTPGSKRLTDDDVGGVQVFAILVCLFRLVAHDASLCSRTSGSRAAKTRLQMQHGSLLPGFARGALPIVRPQS